MRSKGSAVVPSSMLSSSCFRQIVVSILLNVIENMSPFWDEVISGKQQLLILNTHTFTSILCT